MSPAYLEAGNGAQGLSQPGGNGKPPAPGDPRGHGGGAGDNAAVAQPHLPGHPPPAFRGGILGGYYFCTWNVLDYLPQ